MDVIMAMANIPQSLDPFLLLNWHNVDLTAILYQEHSLYDVPCFIIKLIKNGIINMQDIP